MSYARLRSELLAARDAREALLGAILAEAARTVVFASTAVPGPRKRLPGIEALLGWGVTRLQGRIDVTVQTPLILTFPPWGRRG